MNLYLILILILFLFFVVNYFETKGTYSCSTKKILDVSETHGSIQQKNKDFKFTWHQGIVIYNKVEVHNGFLKGTFKVIGNQNNFNSMIFFDQPSHLVNYYNGNLFYVRSSQIAAQVLYAKCKEDF